MTTVDDFVKVDLVPITDECPADAVQLTGKKFAKISSFKGKTFLDIREYYIDTNSVLKPSAKGITLNREGAINLMNSLEDFVNALK